MINKPYIMEINSPRKYQNTRPIGSYDVVKLVAQNMAHIKRINYYMRQLINLESNLSDLKYLYDNLEKILPKEYTLTITPKYYPYDEEK